MDAESLAQLFHETYERLAPQHGYETRKESAVAWSEVPANNKSLMIAVCEEILSKWNRGWLREQRNEGSGEGERIILGSHWFTSRMDTIGVVAARTGMHDPEKGEWKAYIGCAPGHDKSFDEQFVAASGCGLSPEEAGAFFPYLDSTKYKPA